MTPCCTQSARTQCTMVRITHPWYSALMIFTIYCRLQDGVGLRIQSLVEIQIDILGLYPPTAGSHGVGSSGTRRHSLHGGGSGAIAWSDSGVPGSEVSTPSAVAAAAATAEAVALAALGPESRVMMKASEADASRQAGNGPADEGSSRSLHRVSDVSTRRSVCAAATDMTERLAH